jgi:hypothetical protein
MGQIILVPLHILPKQVSSSGKGSDCIKEVLGSNLGWDWSYMPEH